MKWFKWTRKKQPSIKEQLTQLGFAEAWQWRSYIYALTKRGRSCLFTVDNNKLVAMSKAPEITFEQHQYTKPLTFADVVAYGKKILDRK